MNLVCRPPPGHTQSRKLLFLSVKLLAAATQQPDVRMQILCCRSTAELLFRRVFVCFVCVHTLALAAGFYVDFGFGSQRLFRPFKFNSAVTRLAVQHNRCVCFHTGRHKNGFFHIFLPSPVVTIWSDRNIAGIFFFTTSSLVKNTADGLFLFHCCANYFDAVDIVDFLVSLLVNVTFITTSFFTLFLADSYTDQVFTA